MRGSLYAVVKGLLAKGDTDVLVVGAVAHIGDHLVRIVNHKRTPGALGREMLERLSEILGLGVTDPFPKVGGLSIGDNRLTGRELLQARSSSFPKVDGSF